MNVMYVNHTGQVSGGEKSLLEVLRALRSRVRPIVACPDGPLVSAVAELGVERVRIPGTDGSLKLSPRHTTAAVWQLSRAAVAVRTLTRRHRIDLVHANSIRAGLSTTLAREFGAPPTIVHLRDRLPASRATSWTLRTIANADALIANSRFTAAGLDQAGVVHRAHVLGNPVDLARFDPELISRPAARAAVGLREGDFAVAVIAQITPWKGQEEAIRAIDLLRPRHPEVKLLLVGAAKFVSTATRYDNRAYLEGLHRLVADLKLEDHVLFAGERDDIPHTLRALDALLVPSWEEPFGRTMIEAMAMRVPVIATNAGGPAEVITDGDDGLLVPPRQPAAWAKAICDLVESSAKRARIAGNGWTRARAFGADAHANALLALYEEVLVGLPPSAPVLELSAAA